MTWAQPAGPGSTLGSPWGGRPVWALTAPRPFSCSSSPPGYQRGWSALSAWTEPRPACCVRPLTGPRRTPAGQKVRQAGMQVAQLGWSNHRSRRTTRLRHPRDRPARAVGPRGPRAGLGVSHISVGARAVDRHNTVPPGEQPRRAEGRGQPPDTGRCRCPPQAPPLAASGPRAASRWCPTC